MALKGAADNIDKNAVSGKLLQRFAPGDNHATLNMSHLFSGVYLIEATTQSGARVTKRIVKK